MGRPKVCIITTSLLIVRFFLLPQIRELSRIYDLTLVVNVDDPEFLKSLRLPIRVVHLPIERNISISKDLKALYKCFMFLRAEKFAVVHTVAPKAGIIGILAGWMARVPRRLHIFQGEVWQTKKSFFRFVLKSVDKVVAALSTHLLVVSESERQFLVSEKVLKLEKATVLAKGSICGVDLGRFKPNPSARNDILSNIGVAQDSVVLLFVGRLTRDKGIVELVNTYASLSNDVAVKTNLIIVGPDEEGIRSTCEDLLKNTPQESKVHFFPYTDSPETFMAAADILILPSKREGFGLVIIEAAAVGIPAIGSRIVGIVDAIQDGKTGLLFDESNQSDLAEKIKALVCDKLLRDRLGKSAQSRSIDDFAESILVNATIDYYKRNLV